MSFCEHFNSSNCSLLKYVLIPTSDIPNIRCQMFCQIDISDIICPSPTFVPTAVLLLTFLELSDIICPTFVLIYEHSDWHSWELQIIRYNMSFSNICSHSDWHAWFWRCGGQLQLLATNLRWLQKRKTKVPVKQIFNLRSRSNCLGFKIPKRFLSSQS